jgi:hypothetical protein
VTKEEMLDGLTNDLVVLRLRRFFVRKGLPDGKYLLENSEFATGEDGVHRGRLDFVLPERNLIERGEMQFAGDVRVVVDFDCDEDLNPHLSLEINKKKPPIRRDGEIIYRFSGKLRPLAGEA